MKKLILVRHAKAEGGESWLRDIDRSLTSRGVREAYAMSTECKKLISEDAIIVCSSAVRTYSTASIFADQLNISRDKIFIQSKLYESNPDAYFEVLFGIENNFQTVILVGHNPTISEVAGQLLHQQVELSTCAIVAISFSTNKWEIVASAESRLLAMLSPKSLPESD